jgi:hypothetical protein
MNPICPQCKQPIEGIDVTRYAVGWCRLDVHVGCLPLHVRTCRPCRVHNERLATTMPPKTDAAA